MDAPILLQPSDRLLGTSFAGDFSLYGGQPGVPPEALAQFRDASSSFVHSSGQPGANPASTIATLPHRDGADAGPSFAAIPDFSAAPSGTAASSGATQPQATMAGDAAMFPADAPSYLTAASTSVSGPAAAAAGSEGSPAAGPSLATVSDLLTLDHASATALALSPVFAEQLLSLGQDLVGDDLINIDVPGVGTLPLIDDLPIVDALPLAGGLSDLNQALPAVDTLLPLDALPGTDLGGETVAGAASLLTPVTASLDEAVGPIVDSSPLSGDPPQISLDALPGPLLSDAPAVPQVAVQPEGTAAGDSLDLLGSDPEAGIATLVSLVNITDMIDLRDAGAPAEQMPVAPDVIDILAAPAPDPSLLDDGDDDGGALPPLADDLADDIGF